MTGSVTVHFSKRDLYSGNLEKRLIEADMSQHYRGILRAAWADNGYLSVKRMDAQARAYKRRWCAACRVPGATWKGDLKRPEEVTPGDTVCRSCRAGLNHMRPYTWRRDYEQHRQRVRA